MVVISPALPELSLNTLSLYYCMDPLLEDFPVLVYYGPSTIGNSTHNSSRVQAHIYSLAGIQNFSRLTISPSSPLYVAVNHLPLEQRGDEVYRGLAVSLLSYFAAIPKAMKDSLSELEAGRRPNHLAPAMFDEMHAGDLAARMVRVKNSRETSQFLTSALSPRGVSWVDMDVLLPVNTVERFTSSEGSESKPFLGEDGLPLFHYGLYTSLIKGIGIPAFLPTSRLKRAPSRPTAHSKGRSLTKDQKVALRREMCELVDTEQRYISKLRDLVYGIATEVQKLHTDQFGNVRSNSRIVNQLFPDSLHRILETNTLFYDELQDILQVTENEAIQDIEDGSELSAGQGIRVIDGRKTDPTGATLFAKALLRRFPEFMGPYQDYMHTSADFPKIWNEALQDQASFFSRQVHEFGEQRLRSALIEPVQRLPRYSLLIDSIINLIPASHPALSTFLKARDIITDICALDTASTDGTRIVSCLSDLVHAWPESLSPKGRLIAAVDVIELDPPYTSTEAGQASILLLFPDTIVILHKAHGRAMSARGILAEVDRPVIPVSRVDNPYGFTEKTLNFSSAFSLLDLQSNESQDGRLIWLSGNNKPVRLPYPKSNDGHLQPFAKAFALLNPYERKATRLNEEVARARIEGRFSDVIREGDKWALRTISATSETLGAIAAVLEDDNTDSAATLSRIRVFVDTPKTPKSILTQNPGVDIACCITPLDLGRCRLNLESRDGARVAEETTEENVGGILVKILGTVIKVQHQPRDQLSAASHVVFNRDVLSATPIRMPTDEPRTRTVRPLSPVKMISSFLGGGSTNQFNSPSKISGNASDLKSIPPLRPPVFFSSEPAASQKNKESNSNGKVTVVANDVQDTKGPLVLMEDTFKAYVVALRSRSGNVVTKVLRGRAAADELMVNELYNILLEDPSRVQAAAEVSVDVLFAAFEKFLKKAWREHMGPLLATELLVFMQSKLDSGRPNEFSQHLKNSLEEMTPQNRRAFTATINLLSDLLDGSGNDGDRGSLTATFADILVLDGNPYDYITLLDRLVDDYDNLFDEFASSAADGSVIPGVAMDSLNRTRSFNTGSLSSNASSLRKRFGFGNLSRENSKSESESKVASVWRTLSKNSKNTGETSSQPGSLSKASSLLRSRSTDTDTRMLPPLRPVSRDRPISSTSHEEARSRPGSSHLNISTLSTIGEGTPTKPTYLTKKKRRSSLSDLKPLKDTVTVSPWSSPSQLRKPSAVQQLSTPIKTSLGTPIKTSPRVPSSNKLVVGQSADKLSPNRFGSPERFGYTPRSKESPQRFSSLQHKENSPSILRATNPVKPARNPSNTVAATTPIAKRRTPSQTTTKGSIKGLSERTWPPNGTSTPAKKPPVPSQKLRMQSPQKLRERLGQEQKALSGAEASLQVEINKIGEQLSAFKIQRPTTAGSKPSTPASQAADKQLQTLSKSLTSLETDLQNFITTTTARTDALAADLESSLLVADKKAKKLDELYREANAENEALYERFNDELGKILKAVKGGKGEEERAKNMKEGQDECGRLKKENAKLKREVVGLRSLIAD